ncbi:ribosome biogenesis GTPase Der [Candidatus Falkowbacteria bacterium]|nr:MAG: ribosome biogenesis GTPase Der [Candidatus Falkowbacteria bacterium]
MKYTKKNLPSVVLFGRTNVGKSSLFNCLTEKRKALISNIEGTTRDANIGEVNWRGKNLELIDTGGIMDLKYLTEKKTKTTDIEAKVQTRARDYIERADLILFLVDTKAGLLPQDKQMALYLKKILPFTDNIILVANKTDSPKLRREIAEFNKLSLGEPLPISAITGSGTGDLLDEIVKKIRKLKIPSPSIIKNDEKETINVSIIGKPNVGKSSLVNAILENDKNIVSPTPHTTREPQDTLIEHNGALINLIDTAGISKKGQKGAKRLKVKNTLEKFSITKSLKTLKNSDIALLMLDINKTITHQDAKLVEEIVKTKTSLIVIANKWDTVKERNTKLYTQKIYTYLPFIKWAPIQFTSALTGEKVKKVLDIALKVSEERKTEIQANPLNKFLSRIVKKHAPAKGKGTKHPYVYELKQMGANPPIFAIRIGAKDNIHFSYLKFIENRLREKFGFLGTPLKMCIEKNKKIHGKKEEI